MKCLTQIIVLSFVAAVGTAAHATPTNTDRFIHALAESLADRVIGDDELVLLIEGAKRGEVVNPICEATSELSSDRWLAYTVFKSYVDDEDLDVAEVEAWARKNLVDQERGRKKREEAKEKAVLPWKYEPTLISAGERNTCAVKSDGMVKCWGIYISGLDIGPVQSISRGGHSICALKADGKGYWGHSYLFAADEPHDLGPVQSVSCGHHHTCAVKSDGMVACWGYDKHGQVSGHKALNLGQVQSISAGGDHTCAVKADGKVACWGNDNNAKVSGHKKLNLGPVQSISTGGDHTCAVKADGMVACWGNDDYAKVSGHKKLNLGPVQSISTGKSHTCAVKANGMVECWGRDDSGQSLPPLDLGAVRSVSAGDDHTCAIKADGSVACWGSNIWGQSDVPYECGPWRDHWLVKLIARYWK